METKGYHLIAEISGCKNIKFYDNEDNLKKLLLDTANVAKATILSVNTHHFEPFGSSGIVFLAESHIGVHLFIEEAYVSCDIYTCSPNTENEKALEYFAKALGAMQIDSMLVHRGIVNENGISRTAKIIY